MAVVGRRGSLIAALTVGIGAVIIGGGCGSSIPSTSAVATSGGQSPTGATAGTRSEEATPAAPTGATPGGTSRSSPTVTASGIPLADATLLTFIPVTSTGFTLTYDAETTATEVADPSLDPNVAALATGIASPPAPSASAAGDLVIVNVIRLRDATASDTWFRGWRDSYDQAACAPAGGIAGHAEATINGHDTFIGTCAGGAYTYHLRLSGGAVIVSLTSIGFDRLGERIIQAMPTA